MRMNVLEWEAESEKLRERSSLQPKRKELDLSELVILIATKRKAIVRFKAAWRIG